MHSRLSGKFPVYLENLEFVWTFPYKLRDVQPLWKLSGLLEKFPDCLENFLDCLESFPYCLESFKLIWILRACLESLWIKLRFSNNTKVFGLVRKRSRMSGKFSLLS